MFSPTARSIGSDIPRPITKVEWFHWIMVHLLTGCELLQTAWSCCQGNFLKSTYHGHPGLTNSSALRQCIKETMRFLLCLQVGIDWSHSKSRSTSHETSPKYHLVFGNMFVCISSFRNMIRKFVCMFFFTLFHRVYYLYGVFVSLPVNGASKGGVSCHRLVGPCVPVLLDEDDPSVGGSQCLDTTSCWSEMDDLDMVRRCKTRRAVHQDMLSRFRYCIKKNIYIYIQHIHHQNTVR